MAEPTARSRLVPLTSFRTSFWVMLAFCVAVLVVILSTPQSAQAGSKIATLNHTSGEFAVGYPHQRKVLRDASGYWYVAYMDYNGSTSKYEIYLTKSTNTAGTNWATPVKIAGQNGILYNESTYDFRYPAIDIDRTNGRLHLVFNKAITVDSGLDDHLVYSRCTNLSNWNLATSWTQISGGTSPRYDAIQTTVYVAADPIYAPSIALNSSGNVHIGYITPPGSTYLVYHVYGTTSWGSPVQVDSSSYLMGYPTVEVRSNDWVYFAWSLTSSAGGLRRVNHSYSEAAPYDTWAAATYIILQNYDGVDLRYVSMAADDEGNIQVACEQHGTYNPSSSIWGAYFNGASWTMFGLTQPIDTFGWDKPAVGVTLGTGVTTDIIVAARDGTDPDAVYRWKWNGSAWALPAASTLETTDSFVALEKRAPSGSTSMGFVTFDAGVSTGDLYFSRVRFSDTQTQFTVAANSDDATEGYNTTGPVEGYMWLNGAYDRNRATTDPTLIRDDGVRFANVTVPAGATVTGAWFEAYFYDDNGGDGLPPLNDDIDCTVYAHDTDNSSTFTTTTFNITDTGQRPRTSASVPWQKDGLAGDVAGAAAWAGLHVLEPVQEVASRSGWASGNAITLLFIRNPSPSATKSAIWRSRDNGSNYPKLTITYTTLGVELQEHASGQITDQLLGDATQSNVNLFRFQITNERASETTVSQIQFQLSGVSGIYTGDLSNIRIHDGTSNVATGGTASISGTTGTITFTNWVLPAGPATRNYTLIADLSSLQPHRDTDDRAGHKQHHPCRLTPGERNRSEQRYAHG